MNDGSSHSRGSSNKPAGTRIRGYDLSIGDGRYFFVYKTTNAAVVISARDMTRGERKRYEKNKSSISKATSYKEMGEYWDREDLDGIWDQTEPVEFSVSLQAEVNYYSIDSALADKIRDVARRRGVSPQTLLNLWVQEKIQEEKAG